MRFLLTLSLLFLSFAPVLAQSETAPAKNAAPRLPLAEAVTLANVPNADPLASGNVPNYLLAIAQHTKAAPQYANLMQTVIFGGTVAPMTKIAMAAKIAQIYESAYLTAHAQRWARAVAPKQVTLSDTDKLALEYAEKLTRNVNGVTNADFARVRGQIWFSKPPALDD